MKTNEKEITKDCLTCGYFVVDKNGEPHVDIYVNGLKGVPFNQAISFGVVLKSYFETKRIMKEKIGKPDNKSKEAILKTYKSMAKNLLGNIKKDLYERD